MHTISPASKIQANLQELFQAESSPGKAYVRFSLNQELTALFSMKQVQESLIVSADQITPLPSMPSAMIGMMNTRDRVFCVIDIAQLLTLPSSILLSRDYQIIIIEDPASKKLIGFAVPQLLGITRLESESFKLPTSVPDSLIPFVIGCPKELDQELIILDEAEIIKAASIH